MTTAMAKHGLQLLATDSKIRWHDASESKPDADITVLLWLDDGEWCSGFWGGRWFDSTGMPIEAGRVTHYADVAGPHD